jgi:hypothetical protein
MFGVSWQEALVIAGVFAVMATAMATIARVARGVDRQRPRKRQRRPTDDDRIRVREK